MKLFNAIAIFDVFIVAESSESARATLLKWIRDEKLPPTETRAFESRMENSIRASWCDQKPLVADDISDSDFENHVKGHTTLEIFQHIYTRRG